MTKPSVGRLLFIAFIGATLYFAIQGGEYSTFDLVHQYKAKRATRAAVDSLEHLVDSLGKALTAVETDPVVQERIAREQFGMVRGDREVLYRFADTVTGSRPRQ